MLREVSMRMFSSLTERINVLREPSKLQIFPLVSGRHVGVPQTGSNMAFPYKTLSFLVKPFAE